MGSGKRLTEYEQEQITAFKKEGLSNQAIGKKIGRSEKVVRNFLKKGVEYGNYKNSGRKPKLTQKEKRRIVSTASNSIVSANEIIRSCGVNVSRQTIYRTLSRTGLKQPKPVQMSNWDNLSWTCYYCSQNIDDLATLKYHLQSLHLISNAEEAYYQCNDCSTPHFGYASFINHIRGMHHEALKLCCDVCSEILPDYEQLSLHRDEHINILSNSFPIIYHCTLCEQVHSTEKELKNHIQYSHNFMSSTKINHSPYPITKEKDSKTLQPITSPGNIEFSVKFIKSEDEYHETEQTYQCGICVQSFVNEADFQTHMNDHTNKAVFKCDFCPKSYDWKSRLDMHIITHNEERSFKCDFCDKRFKRKEEKKVHMRRHLGQRPYKCNACEKSFGSSDNLKEHTRIHTGERPFECEICGQSFCRQGTLNRHMAIHSNVRPNKCEICDKSFKRKEEKIIHMRIHTGERPFKCEICLRTCTTSGHLKEHIRTHTGERPYVCELCPKSFALSGNLKSHMSRRHSDNSAYKCMKCSKRFIKSSDKEKHENICQGPTQTAKKKANIKVSII